MFWMRGREERMNESKPRTYINEEGKRGREREEKRYTNTTIRIKYSLLHACMKEIITVYILYSKIILYN